MTEFAPHAVVPQAVQVFLKHAADLIALLDPDGRVLHQNRVWSEHLGHHHAHPLLEQVHPDDRCVVSHFGLHQQLEGQTVSLRPFRLMDREGGWKWYEGTATHLLTDPEVGGVLMSLREVSHRMRHEQQARQAQGLTALLSAVQTLDEVVQVVLLQGLEAVQAVAGGVMLVQQDQVEVLGTAGYPERLERPWRTFPLAAPTPAGDAIRQGTDRFLNVEDWALHYPHLSHTNTHSHAVLLLQGEKETVGALTLSFQGDHTFSETERAFLQDVASRVSEALRRALLHEKLQRQERTYRKLTEHSHDLMVVLDGQGIYQYVSPVMQSMLGYTPGEKLGTPCFARVHPEDVGRVIEEFARVLQHPEHLAQVTYRYQHQDGSWVWLESNGLVCLSDPDINGVVIHSRNVTERTRSEQQVKAELERFQHLVELLSLFGQHPDFAELVESTLQVCLELSPYQQGFYVPLKASNAGEAAWAGEGAADLYLHAREVARDHLQNTTRAGQDALCFTATQEAWTQLALLPIRVKGKVRAMLMFGAQQEQGEVDMATCKVLHGVSEQLSHALERTVHLDELHASREETLRSMGLMLEYRDYETKGHTDRVVQLSEQLGKKLGLSETDLEALRWGAYLHDTGKVAIPDHILLKPGKLDAQEWEAMKRHPVIGHQLLMPIPNLPHATLDVVLHHHERWDGSGYPARQSGEEIPLLARLFALIDVYDALTDERPYKRRWTHQEAVAEIQRTAGSHFDPHLAGVFLEMVSEQ